MPRTPRHDPTEDLGEVKYVSFRLPTKILPMLDKQAAMRGMSRNGFVIYMARAFDLGLVMIEDPSTYGAWKQEQLNQVCRTARVAARDEVQLFMLENGYTTSEYQS